MSEPNDKLFIVRFNKKLNTEKSDGLTMYSSREYDYTKIPIGQKVLLLGSYTEQQKYKTAILKSVTRVDYNSEHDNRLNEQGKKRYKDKMVWKFCFEIVNFNVTITDNMKYVQYPRLV